MRLGGHLSIGEGLRHVIVSAHALSYQCVQIMVGGGADYRPLQLTPKDAAEFKQLTFGIDVYVHLPYIINPCESMSSRVGFYKKAFKDFCRTASMLGAKAVIIHPGFKKELTEAQAALNFTKFFASAFEEDLRLSVYFETDAGSKNGSAIGSPEFIGNRLTELDNSSFAMCIDTTHLYARGTDLWDKEERDILFDQFGRVIKLVHLNSPDPEVYLGSNKDRHNTPFQDHDWDHKGLFEAVAKWPCILERRSLAVQEQDAAFIRKTLDVDPLKEEKLAV